MAYRIVKTRTFTCNVPLIVPTDEGQVAQSLTARFRVTEGGEQMQVEEFLRAAVLHLSDIVDDDGAPVEFSPALLEQIIAEPWARVGLIKAYWSEMAGGQARAKN